VSLKRFHIKPALVTWGLWARVRHPIYLAGIFVNFGIALLIGTVLIVILPLGYAMIKILLDTILEERNLRKNFPKEYEEYSRKVPSWIPRIG
tara:strand:+ start:703 stop:978 length:276 start_codon:yes stop_codon:yes gene_type:complete